MDEFLLRDLTHDVSVDNVTRGFIRVVELLFPGRIRACYLTGSSIDGTAAHVVGDSLNSSDIDITVVFKGKAEQHEQDRFKDCRRACEELSQLGLDQLDAVALDEDGLFERGDVTLGTASMLLYGEDIRASIPLPRLSDHIDHAIGLSFDLLGTLRGIPATALTLPLVYPDGEGEFYGYDYREEAYGGKPGTRILVDTVSWMATALVALQAGRCAGTKSDAVRLYRERIADEWTEVVEGVYECCKLRWATAFPGMTRSANPYKACAGRFSASRITSWLPAGGISPTGNQTPATQRLDWPAVATHWDRNVPTATTDEEAQRGLGDACRSPADVEARARTTTVRPSKATCYP